MDQKEYYAVCNLADIARGGAGLRVKFPLIIESDAETIGELIGIRIGR